MDPGPSAHCTLFVKQSWFVTEDRQGVAGRLAAGSCTASEVACLSSRQLTCGPGSPSQHSVRAAGIQIQQLLSSQAHDAVWVQCAPEQRRQQRCRRPPAHQHGQGGGLCRHRVAQLWPARERAPPFQSPLGLHSAGKGGICMAQSAPQPAALARAVGNTRIPMNRSAGGGVALLALALCALAVAAGEGLPSLPVPLNWC